VSVASDSAQPQPGFAGAGYEWPIDLRVMLAFGLDGLQSQDALAGTLTQPRTRTYEVAEVFERLEHEELIATAGSRWSRSSSGPRYRRR
jgi:hypothetical protein